MVEEVPGWTQEIVGSRLAEGEQVESVQIVEDKATSKIAVAHTPDRTFLAKKALVGGSAYELTPALRDGTGAETGTQTATDRVDVSCTSCGTSFGLWTEDGAGDVRCISCGEPVTGSGETEGLTQVPGVGPAFAERLTDAGIEDVGALLDADPETLADETGIAENRIARIRTLGGLTDVRGVGTKTARALFAIGIGDAETLAEVDPARLTEIEWISEGRAQRLVQAARDR